MMDKKYELIAPCHFGLEAVLKREIQNLGYEISQGMDLKLLDKLEASNNYGIAVMKGENGELLDMINAGLANLKASGEYDAIIGTYIQD